MYRNRMLRPAFAASLLLVAGCAGLRGHWPFGHKAAAAPTPVSELMVVLPDQQAVPVVLQYWERNTLVVDLTSVPGTGRITLQPRPEHGWPARIAFRMLPARFEALEVRGAERVVWPVAANATGPVTTDLPPEVYGAKTPELVVSWGAAAGF